MFRAIGMIRCSLLFEPSHEYVFAHPKFKMCEIFRTLHWLPPYSPELNPVEHLWDDIREKWFCNHPFESLDAVELQLVNGLRYYLSAPADLSSLTLFPWMKLDY